MKMADLNADSEKQDVMLNESSPEVTNSSPQVTSSSPEVTSSSQDATNRSTEVTNESKQPVMWKFKVICVYMGIFLVVTCVLFEYLHITLRKIITLKQQHYLYIFTYNLT